MWSAPRFIQCTLNIILVVGPRSHFLLQHTRRQSVTIFQQFAAARLRQCSERQMFAPIKAIQRGFNRLFALGHDRELEGNTGHEISIYIRLQCLPRTATPTNLGISSSFVIFHP
jgi:hypothetical protein